MRKPIRPYGICVAIDPGNAGSTIAGHICEPTIRKVSYSDKYDVLVDASLTLSDCSRIIKWEMVHYDEDRGFNLGKLDLVIDLLTKYRAALQRAEDKRKKLEAEVTVLNANIEAGKTPKAGKSGK